MADAHDEKDTFIKDSNVEIIITNGDPNITHANRGRTDYWSMIIVAIIMLALAAYGMWTKYINR